MIAGSLVLYGVFARAISFDEESIREWMGRTLQLTKNTPAPDIGVMLWLSFVNPVMEEFFWRLFLFELLFFPRKGLVEPLVPRQAPRTGRPWWQPCILISMLYASYHVPVVWGFLPTGLVAVAWVSLVGLGIFLQVRSPTFLDLRSPSLIVPLGICLQLVVERIGLVLATAIHCAIDVVASVIFAGILWDWSFVISR